MTMIYFGPVPGPIAGNIGGEATLDEAERAAWSPVLDWPGVDPDYDGGEVGFQIAASFDEQAIVSGSLVWGELSLPGVDWRPFAKRLREFGLAHDFIRSERRWEGARDDAGAPLTVEEKILVRWRPGMDDPHEVCLDAHGKPSLNAAQLGLVYEDAEGEDIKGKIRGLLGADLGRLDVRTVSVIENAEEVALALGTSVPGVGRYEPESVRVSEFAQ